MPTLKKEAEAVSTRVKFSAVMPALLIASTVSVHLPTLKLSS